MSSEQIQKQITESDSTSEEIRKETIQVLKDADNIINLAEEKWKDTDEIKKEYEEIRQTAIDSFKNDNSITQNELNLIKLELTQLNKLSGDSKEHSVFDKLAFIPETVWITSDLLDSVWIDTTDLNTSQDELIDEILWGPDLWFWNWYVKWFNKEIWNYITKISDFESKLQEPSLKLKDINSREIANYIMYLNENWWITKNILIEKFWSEKTKDLKYLWKKTKDTIAKNMLKDAWFEKIIEKVINFSDIIENPLLVINISEDKLPTSIWNVSINKLQNFTEKYSKSCPNLPKLKDRKKFEKILTIAQVELINKIWEEKAIETTTNIIKSRIEWQIPEELKIEIEKFSLFILKEWIKILNTPWEEPCSFDLRAFTDKELQRFIESDNISQYLDNKNKKLSDNEFQNLASAITWANLEEKKQVLKQMNDNPTDYSKQAFAQINQEIQLAERIQYVSNNLTSKEVNEYSILVEEKWREAAIQEIVNKSPKLSKYFNDENIDIPSVSNSTSEINYKPVEISKWSYSLQTESWEIIEWLIISEKEKKIIEWNPEATENLINFYEFFRELNLESVWEYREEIAISIWNRNINFNDKDSVSKAELLKFWNSIISIVNNLNNKKQKNNAEYSQKSNIDWMKNELRKFSWALSSMSDNTTKWIEWEDPFKYSLRQFWIIWWAYFNIHKLRENIK
jgi:hypothetical protein